MNALRGWLLALLAASGAAWAELAPVEVTLPQADAWAGQRVAIFVELRAHGPFQGTARFDLPQLPGVLLMKVGSPVVGSREIEGASWFLQTHEFALFAQREGSLALPAIAVHFAALEGLAGPAREVDAHTQPLSIAIRRPPGSASGSFLVTTEELEVNESWDPPPGPMEIGGVLRRRIVQRARNLPAMALAAAPAGAIEGVRVYASEPRVRDMQERGDFLGEREETLSYLLQSPGRVTLPAIDYAWWNPQTQALTTSTLPAVHIEVSAPANPAARSAAHRVRTLWWLPAVLLVASLAAWQHARIRVAARNLRSRMDSPHRKSLRALRRACARNDAAAAYAAWLTWRSTREAGFAPDAALRDALHALEARLFGHTAQAAWQGAALERAVAAHAHAARRAPARAASALPRLNPGPD